MKKLIRTGLLVFTVASLATSARGAVDLSSLLVPGSTLQVGDKIFGNFTFAGSSGPAGFNITGVGDGSAGNLYGIQIGGPFAQVGAGSSDWQLGYSVQVAPGAGFLISDIHQQVNIGSADAGTVAHVSEDVLDAPGGSVVAHSLVGKTFSNPVDANDPPAELNDILNLANPLNQVWVSKDIFLSAGVNEAISATIITQRFSQVPVPEPTTLLCGALLLLPFGASTIRIARKKHTA